jgi:hypothetical protein
MLNLEKHINQITMHQTFPLLLHVEEAAGVEGEEEEDKKVEEGG